MFFRTGLRFRQCSKYELIESFYPLLNVIRMHLSASNHNEDSANSDGMEKEKVVKPSIAHVYLSLLTVFGGIKTLRQPDDSGARRVLDKPLVTRLLLACRIR